MKTTKTNAATRFIDAIQASWGSEQYAEMAYNDGLSDRDSDTLSGFCDEAEEDYAEAEAEVLAFVRSKLLQTKDFAENPDAAGFVNWKMQEVIASYTANLFGKDGCSAGKIEVVLEQAIVGQEYGVEVAIYRWRESDVCDGNEFGKPTMDRDEAIRDGEAHAESGGGWF